MKKQKARLVIFYNEKNEDEIILVQFYSEVEKCYLTEVKFYVEKGVVSSNIFIYLNRYKCDGYDIKFRYAPLKHLEYFENGEC